MKSILIMTTIAASALSAAAGSPIDVRWNIGEALPGGSRTNHIVVVNNTDRPLRAPWSLYYGSLASVLASDDPAISPEQVCGTHHRILVRDASLAPGDSLTLDLRGWYNHLYSFFPENAYVVADDDPSTPLRASLAFREADHREMAASIDGYPTGERVYAHNERLMPKSMPGIYDIIPAFKSVALSKGKPAVFNGSVSLRPDADLASEASVLTRMLLRQGVTVSPDGMPVSLKLDKSMPADESYTMTVDPAGVVIASGSGHGAFNGCMSLLAVLAGQSAPLSLPAAVITDAPSMGYRGLHFDVARNFTAPGDVLRVIDLMALYKLNKLHFHLVDDEGWRLAIEGLEELTEIGSRRAQTVNGTALYPSYGSGMDGARTGNGFYTRQDFLDILRYATDRHIEVIPEIDIPGHSRAAIKAMEARYNRYKDTDPAKAEEYLISDFADTSVYRSAQDYHDNVMNIAMPASLRFSKKVFDELVGMYAEAGAPLTTIHVGGDEVPEGAWEGSPIARAYMQANGIADTRALRDEFLLKLHDYLKPQGIRLAGWQEILTAADGKSVNRRMPGHEMLSYSWNTQPYNDMDQVTYDLVNSGFPTVLCNVNNLYLDLAYGKNVQEPGLTWGGFVDEFSTFSTLPYDLYRSSRHIDRPTDWDKDLSAGKLALNPEARPNIAGVQGQMWAESFRDFDMVQERMLPKVFGVAERGWNPEPEWADGSYEDFREAAARYAVRTGLNEFGRLAMLNAAYHVAAPGLKVTDGRLYANAAYPNAVIHYTVDGSDPTEASPVWTAPVAVADGATVRAIAVVNGRKSFITELFQ